MKLSPRNLKLIGELLNNQVDLLLMVEERRGFIEDFSFGIVFVIPDPVDYETQYFEILQDLLQRLCFVFELHPSIFEANENVIHELLDLFEQI